MLRVDPSQISTRVKELLREMDRLRITRAMDIPGDLDQWRQEYAKNAAFHSTRLDEYMRTVRGPGARPHSPAKAAKPPAERVGPCLPRTLDK